MIDDIKDAGIFGMKQSGKTTLAKKLSLYFAARGRPTIVLDPQSTMWGKHATKFSMDQETEFFETAWREKGCLVIIEEAAATIQRSRELVPVFTRLHHNDHKILVVGHGGADLLPTMRHQLDQIFLFRQPADEALEWSREFTQVGIRESENLQQYEFIHCGRYSTPQKFLLTKS